jgi:hypothetical protein
MVCKICNKDRDKSSIHWSVTVGKQGPNSDGVYTTEDGFEFSIYFIGGELCYDCWHDIVNSLSESIREIEKRNGNPHWGRRSKVKLDREKRED